MSKRNSYCYYIELIICAKKIFVDERLMMLRIMIYINLTYINKKQHYNKLKNKYNKYN